MIQYLIFNTDAGLIKYRPPTQLPKESLEIIWKGYCVNIGLDYVGIFNEEELKNIKVEN